MKSKYLKPIETIASALLLTLLLGGAPAQPTFAQTTNAAPATDTKPATPAGMVRYEAEISGSKMKMDGVAAFIGIDHGWSMESVLIGGYIEADAKFPESALTDPKAAKPTVSVYMPVTSFKSGKDAMDKRMQKEMKATQFRRIEYKLIELKPKSAAGATGPLKFDAIGALTVAGHTQTNTMTVTIEKVGDTKLKVSGTTPMKMTACGIEPPSLAGAFTTHDDLTLTFEWLLAQKQ